MVFRASQEISADISPGKELDWILPCEPASGAVRVTFTSVQWPRRSHWASGARLRGAEGWGSQGPRRSSGTGALSCSAPAAGLRGPGLQAREVGSRGSGEGEQL